MQPLVGSGMQAGFLRSGYLLGRGILQMEWPLSGSVKPVACVRESFLDHAGSYQFALSRGQEGQSYLFSRWAVVL